MPKALWLRTTGREVSLTLLHRVTVEHQVFPARHLLLEHGWVAAIWLRRRPDSNLIFRLCFCLRLVVFSTLHQNLLLRLNLLPRPVSDWLFRHLRLPAHSPHGFPGTNLQLRELLFLLFPAGWDVGA